MEIRDWDKRYRLREHAASDLEAAPTPLVVATALKLVPGKAPGKAPLKTPGKALDLACGAGRNALWLAEHGWDVTAVDGAQTAIEILPTRAMERGLKINAVVADLENGEFEIEPSHWDLIAICYYLQRNLFEPAKRGVAPGSVLISIVHITEPGEDEGPTVCVPASWNNISQAGKFFTASKARQATRPIAAPSQKLSLAARYVRSRETRLCRAEPSSRE